jgi:hypothetical protein
VSCGGGDKIFNLSSSEKSKVISTKVTQMSKQKFTDTKTKIMMTIMIRNEQGALRTWQLKTV